MRKSILITLVLSVSVLSLSSCDTFRRMAGRPTSDEIELKRRQIENIRLENERLKSRQKYIVDSVAAAVTDSLSRVMAKSHHDCPARVKTSSGSRTGNKVSSNAKKSSSVYTTAITHKYYVIVGSFDNRKNAEFMAKKVKAYGYAPTLINLKNGRTGVGILPADDSDAALASKEEALKEPFCPSDAWIFEGK